MLELRNVSYQVDNRQIINNINLKIEAGETIAIVGPSGSGKSTLLRLMNNLISPTEGNYILIIKYMKILVQKS